MVAARAAAGSSCSVHTPHLSDPVLRGLRVGGRVSGCFCAKASLSSPPCSWRMAVSLASDLKDTRLKPPSGETTAGPPGTQVWLGAAVFLPPAAAVKDMLNMMLCLFYIPWKIAFLGVQQSHCSSEDT